MNWERVFGGNPVGVVIRLVLISIAVGIVMNVLGIDLSNFFHRINVLLRNIYDLGFGAIDSILQYLVLGAMVVVPIWLVFRLISTTRQKRKSSADVE